VASLPAGAITLASNEFGIQAVSFTHARGAFWGVQYHPEYDYLDIAAAADRYGQILVDDGMFHELAALQAFAAELRALQERPADEALLWKHGLGPALRSEPLRLLEIRNWLDRQVLTRAARHR
jgi:GMP synthase (glutamine-hydrolysing)